MVDQLLSIQTTIVGPERAAEAVEGVRSDRMTSRATTAKTSGIFVGSPQKRIRGSASIADSDGPGTTVHCRVLIKNE